MKRHNSNHRLYRLYALFLNAAHRALRNGHQWGYALHTRAARYWDSYVDEMNK